MIQSEVEQFMIEVFHNDYFLVNSKDLEINDVGNYVYDDGLWIMTTPVKVKTDDVHTTFTIEN
jgi:hypothetical protein